ncbi:hypothetical protein Cadr_000026454 [Camelus dromedarius]|uniref:Uncharacterized protein n=1 Tax=Camelus dromedarius TaxID=9838 RepID=A0A5N4CF03_CAMDR|nr:hypothetical protein Cadr_000026454 [Camelus dromedarius]
MSTGEALPALVHHILIPRAHQVRAGLPVGEAAVEEVRAWPGRNKQGQRVSHTAAAGDALEDSGSAVCQWKMLPKAEKSPSRGREEVLNEKRKMRQKKEKRSGERCGWGALNYLSWWGWDEAGAVAGACHLPPHYQLYRVGEDAVQGQGKAGSWKAKRLATEDILEVRIIQCVKAHVGGEASSYSAVSLLHRVTGGDTITLGTQSSGATHCGHNPGVDPTAPAAFQPKDENTSQEGWLLPRQASVLSPARGIREPVTELGRSPEAARQAAPLRTHKHRLGWEVVGLRVRVPVQPHLLRLDEPLEGREQLRYPEGDTKVAPGARQSGGTCPPQARAGARVGAGVQPQVLQEGGEQREPHAHLGPEGRRRLAHPRRRTENGGRRTELTWPVEGAEPCRRQRGLADAAETAPGAAGSGALLFLQPGPGTGSSRAAATPGPRAMGQELTRRAALRRGPSFRGNDEAPVFPDPCSSAAQPVLPEDVRAPTGDFQGCRPAGRGAHTGSARPALGPLPARDGLLPQPFAHIRSLAGREGSTGTRGRFLANERTHDTGTPSCRTPPFIQLREGGWTHRPCKSKSSLICTGQQQGHLLVLPYLGRKDIQGSFPGCGDSTLTCFLILVGRGTLAGSPSLSSWPVSKLQTRVFPIRTDHATSYSALRNHLRERGHPPSLLRPPGPAPPPAQGWGGTPPARLTLSASITCDFRIYKTGQHSAASAELKPLSDVNERSWTKTPELDPTPCANTASSGALPQCFLRRSVFAGQRGCSTGRGK